MENCTTRTFSAVLAGLTLILATGCGDSEPSNNDADVSGFAVSPDPIGVEPGGTRTVTVSLDEPAEEARTFTLEVEDTDVASVPTDVTVPQGEQSATFVVSGVAAGTTTLHVGGLAVEVHVVAPGFTCSDSASGTFGEGGGLEVEAAGDLTGAAVSDPGDNLFWPLSSRTVTFSCVDDIVPPGFRAVGPAVQLEISGGALEKFVEIDLPFKSALLPDGAHHGQLRVAVQLRSYPVWTPPVPNIWVEEHPTEGRLRFRYDEGATFQVVIPEDAAQPISRHFTYRAIIGFSMGGGGAGSVGLSNPDRFDFVAQMGGEPGVDMVYAIQTVRDYLLSGFCTAMDQAEGVGNIGELCPVRRDVLERQYERPASYEHWINEPWEGTYINLRREFYIRAMRDLIRAMGNPFYHNPDSHILPPGVPVAHLQDATPCETPVVFQDFYDREYNPDGAFDVITFCDASQDEDSPDLGLAVFDPALPKTNPLYVALAVDVNGNGVRDSGEPVISMMREPFKDWGIDGVPDASEVGYDPVTNPDPAGDNYHWLKNPGGTEGNWAYEPGEPFEDCGLDGVCGQGCEVDSGTPGCYDHGEGNSLFDMTHGYLNWLDHGARTLYGRLTEEQRKNTVVWSDSGMRDFFNCHVSTNQFAGMQALTGEQVRVYFGFQRLINEDVTRPVFDFQKVNYQRIGRQVYVLYGNPDASENAIAQGDGRHVGTGLEFVYRLNTPIAFISQHWPGGDYEQENDDRPHDDHFLGTGDDPLSFTAQNGRETYYSLYLPPGYYLDKNASLRYPVIYVLHGYGQEPDDIIEASGVFENYMISPTISDYARFQKFIIVYVDGRCRPGGKLGTGSGGQSYMSWADLSGDLCEKGTFYADSPTGSPALGRTHLLELMDIVDANFRTKAAETVEILP